MLHIKEVTISKGVTLNLGNHTFSKVEIGMTATVDDEDLVSDLDGLTNLVNAKLAQEVAEIMPPAKKKTLMEKKTV